jgi:hypothetical protein
MSEKAKVRVGHLKTLGRVSSEIARVYRETRRKELSTTDGMRLVQMLIGLKTSLEAGDVEVQIAELRQLIRGEEPRPSQLKLVGYKP